MSDIIGVYESVVLCITLFSGVFDDEVTMIVTNHNLHKNPIR